MDPSAYSFPVSSGTIWWDGSAVPLLHRFIAGHNHCDHGTGFSLRGGGFREDFTRLVDAALIERR